MTTRLVLIRHGITQWNIQKRYCGYQDVSLSKQGKIQAVELRKNIKNIRFDRIYCSDRKRALMTKAILFGKTDFIKEKDLREIHFGLIEGLNYDQIMQKYPKAYKEWLTDPYKGRIPQAESMQVFKKRVMGAIKKILTANCGKTIAVVCHGGVIAIFVSSILQNRKFWSYVPHPASVTVIDYKDHKFKIKVFDKKQIRGC